MSFSEIVKRELPFLGPDPLEPSYFEGFDGKIAHHPSGAKAIEDLYDVLGVLGGFKPIALVSVYDMTKKKDPEHITKAIKFMNSREICVMIFKVRWRRGTTRNRIVAYLPENKERALKVIYVRAKHDADGLGNEASIDAKIGYLLGYSDEKVISYANNRWGNFDAEIYSEIKAEVDNLELTQEEVEEMVGFKIIVTDQIPLELFVPSFSKMVEKELPFLGKDPLKTTWQGRYFDPEIGKNTQEDNVARDLIGSMFDLLSVMGGFKTLALTYNKKRRYRKFDQFHIEETIKFINKMGVTGIIWKRPGTIHTGFIPYLPIHKNLAIKLAHLVSYMGTYSKLEYTIALGYLLGYPKKNIMTFAKSSEEDYLKYTNKIDEWKISLDDFDYKLEFVNSFTLN